MPAPITERIDAMPFGAYYTYDEPEDIKLCLECPYDTCNNCLDEPHDVGVRPAHRYEDARIEAKRLLLENKLPLWQVARLSHTSLTTVRKLLEELSA